MVGQRDAIWARLLWPIENNQKQKLGKSGQFFLKKKSYISEDIEWEGKKISVMPKFPVYSSVTQTVLIQSVYSSDFIKTIMVTTP